MNLLLAALIGAVTLGTEWQDVPDTNTVGSVLNLGHYNATNAANWAIGRYDDTNLAARISAKYTKPEAGIPMADLKSDLQQTIYGKQDRLVSGTNIKTINNQSVVGPGNIRIDVPTDYVTPGEAARIVTNSVAPWAMAGKAEPQGMTTNAVLGITAGKRDLTNNVCSADSFAYSAWSKENLPSGVTWDDQPTYDASIDLWEWGYDGGSAQSEEGGADATSLTFGYGEGFASTRTAARVAASNDTYATYGFVTNALAHAMPDLTSRTTFAQATNIAAYASASVSNALDSAKRDKLDMGVYEVTYAPWHTDTGPGGGLYADFAYTGTGGTVWRGRTDASQFTVSWEVHDDGAKKWAAYFYGYSMENTTAAEDALSVTLTDTGGTYPDVTITRQYVSGVVKSEAKKLATTNDIGSIAAAVAASAVTSGVPAWARADAPPVGMTDNAAVLTNGALKTRGGTAVTAANVSGAQTAADVQTAIESAGHMTQTAADAAYYPLAQGQAWSSYWDGDDVRVTVTNYDSSVNLPSLYLEQRTNETALATNLFRTVWREMAHWDAFLGTNWDWRTSWGGFQTWKTAVAAELDEKADRAWGYYNSHTGTYSPDGYTQISSSNVMIAAGMSYQKTVTTSAEVWVLTANEPYEPTGVSTNGGFQIRDGDGNIQLEIVKGDKVTVAAQANAVTVDTATTPNTLAVTYNITAAAHPTAEVCLDLAAASWKAETAADCPATVTWSGSSGAYVARVQPNAATAKCFVRATYQRGGDTYINNRCAVGMSQLVLGGVTYTLGTATIDGHTVLTLTPAN